MTRDTLQIPSTRTWRDIPQPVVPRAMSREGRWRLTMATIRATTVVLICVATGYAIWLVAGSLGENANHMPAVAKSTPLQPPILKTDGVLDQAWLVRTLALPHKASLLELDLDQLRARVLGDQQVVSATLTRNFPDRLIVQITERVPIARVMTEWMGQQHPLLVARDGVVYDGKNYDQPTLDTLPWLDGVSLIPDRGRFRPIAGMDLAAELLAKARLEAEHLYATWGVLSLAHLVTDHQLEIRTKGDGVTILFNTRDDFFRQLARLNYIWDQLEKYPSAHAKIDLSLGDEVPVMVDMPAGTDQPGRRPPVSPPAAAPSRPAAGLETVRLAVAPAAVSSQPAFFILPSPQPQKIHREL